MISAVSVLYFCFHLVTPKIICNSCILCRWRGNEDLAIFKGKKFVRLEKSVQGLTNKNKMADLVSIAMNLWKKHTQLTWNTRKLLFKIKPKHD